ncbi:MAG: HU family DNA-binding protein [Zymomonas mobilis subsp. pomaceae]|uniref:Histone family protein DNA-binding protein n=1 Tax=Zymomonas mobilis subsp. pomaceae (strain ATCC 29192 / DSM 22645 / JCM 10191 / CCUG 17912 / NBRC 13757 / NCIMB 11200 / NRRL B-4491 / Barker I) TaxID=579138 RepID=F8ESQ1_ZYMMT|nr:HU family DNA-binding protein [Zymomonas mobilis]AEI37826.1 histone family protein DNA-binding protein [Zymomonas mobilis subsp. pomaceae ATCC 29192]MDX5949193.1 HU family DNA-binding protein [Zymomonas mobilis subsp. pomaceae]GEB89579.1 integration host factor [Zymomonas mobilis subsp. pomaceae]
MNSNDLVDRIASGQGLTKTDAKKLVDAVFSTIVDAAVAGEEIALNGFGKFKVKHSAARKGHNPATLQEIEIPASNRLTFTSAKAVKDRLND